MEGANRAIEKKKKKKYSNEIPPNGLNEIVIKIYSFLYKLFNSNKAYALLNIKVN